MIHQPISIYFVAKALLYLATLSEALNPAVIYKRYWKGAGKRTSQVETERMAGHNNCL